MADRLDIIKRLQALGLSRNQILDRLNGPAHQRNVTRAELQAIGFSPDRIQKVLRNQRAGRATWGTKDNSLGALREARAAQTREMAEADSEFDQSAFDYMAEALKQYGLDSLTGVLRDLVTDGVTDAASLTLELQDTQEWKTRFAGNEALKQKGLPVLSTAEYLAVERSYAQIMKNAGLPEGFYDDPADFAQWIGNSVSANELQQRVGMYADLAKREDPAITDQLKSMGFSDGDITAYLMDPKKAQPLVQQKYQTALLGAAARRQGVGADNAYLAGLADRGVTEQQAQQGYGMISENLDDLQRLGDIYGQDYTQRDLESEVFESDGKATKKRKTLASQERAAFSGSSGVGQGSLSRNTAGSY